MKYVITPAKAVNPSKTTMKLVRSFHFQNALNKSPSENLRNSSNSRHFDCKEAIPKGFRDDVSQSL